MEEIKWPSRKTLQSLGNDRVISSDKNQQMEKNMEDKIKSETVCTTKSLLAFNLQTAAAALLLLAVCWWCLLSVRVTHPQTQSRRRGEEDEE